MSAGRASIPGRALIVVLLATPFLAFYVARDSAPAWLAGAVAATQITAIGLFLSRTWTTRYRVMFVIALLLVVALALVLPGPPAHAVGLIVAGGCHAVAYACLLFWFGASLRPGREPVVTGFARRLRRTMPENVVCYTRQATIAWCIFFATQLAVSGGLLLLATESTWSTFVNLLNMPLVAAMALAEISYRLILFRHAPRTRLIDMMAALRHVPADRP
jgi:uncharacterized membrane protein